MASQVIGHFQTQSFTFLGRKKNESDLGPPSDELDLLAASLNQ